ncbi:hypothetical protein OQA88_11074 [Cercophora sp. LCS_1]
MEKDHNAPQGNAPQPAAQDGAQNVVGDAWPNCQRVVLGFFPDMCLEHLMKLATEHAYNSEAIVDYVFEDQENGNPYPKQQNPAKRKRPDDELDFGNDDKRLQNKDNLYLELYRKASREFLKASFPTVFASDIDSTLKMHKSLLYPTYLALDEMVTANQGKFKKNPSRKGDPGSLFDNTLSPPEQMAVAEYKAASAVCQAKKEEAEARERHEREENLNLERAKAEGTMQDCECCFDDQPLNRMVCCDGPVTHFFCRNCAKQHAATEIGQFKYELKCMSMDGCPGGFSRDQKNVFLDEGMKKALDRIEQDRALADIPGLSRCPFCPYAEEYPPVEENKIFDCKNPGCEKSSCRLCQKDSHIPKTCEEVVREQGESARHLLEEAMSEALMRKCNKCKAAFIKEAGCNKMTCVKCHNMQCYVCSQSITDYNHFNDPHRGGRVGNCPLFDSVEQRHEQDVQAAAQRERQRIVDENPELDPNALQIEFSENVIADDERRKAANPGPPVPPVPPAPRMPVANANPEPARPRPPVPPAAAPPAAVPPPLRQEFHFLGGEEFRNLQQQQAVLDRNFHEVRNVARNNIHQERQAVQAHREAQFQAMRRRQEAAARTREAERERIRAEREFRARVDRERQVQVRAEDEILRARQYANPRQQQARAPARPAQALGYIHPGPLAQFPVRGGSVPPRAEIDAAALAQGGAQEFANQFAIGTGPMPGPVLQHVAPHHQQPGGPYQQAGAPYPAAPYQQQPVGPPPAQPGAPFPGPLGALYPALPGAAYNHQPGEPYPQQPGAPHPGQGGAPYPVQPGAPYYGQPAGWQPAPGQFPAPWGPPQPQNEQYPPDDHMGPPGF